MGRSANMCHKIKHYINIKESGFMGTTHYMISLALFMGMSFIPWLSIRFVHPIYHMPLLFIVTIFVYGGAALLPDLDCSPLEGGTSTAIEQLGILGNAISFVMITISGIVRSTTATKHDNLLPTQHRYLWHTFLIPILLFVMVYFGIPSNNLRLIDTYHQPIHDIPQIITVVLCSISVYLGASMFLYRVCKLIHLGKFVQFACLFLMCYTIFYMLTQTYNDMRFLGFALSLGYAFHLCGDALTQGGIPYFFPLPTLHKGKIVMWNRPWLLGPLSIRTGGLINSILNFIMLIIDIILFYIVFIKPNVIL